MRFASLLLVLVAAQTALAQSLFLDILPAGQDGLVPQSTGLPGAHAEDQLAMYRDLIVAAPGLAQADLLGFFKDATIKAGADPAPTTPRSGVTITRDAFGVPHVAGATRGDVFFGAGYVTARDRLFFTDVLRHLGRGRLSEFLASAADFLGGIDALIAMDADSYRDAGYSEAELQQQLDQVALDFPEFGPEARNDADEFTAGMNQYISEARVDANKMPMEYGLFGITLEDWKTTDLIAIGTLFTATFGNGGGGEHDNVELLQALQAKHGAADGNLLFADLRGAADPEAPTTGARRAEFPAEPDTSLDPLPAGTAIPDAGSIVRRDPITTSAPVVAAAKAFRFSTGMSNWFAINASNAQGGHPILVGGPQTGYFAPQVLLELSLEGGGVKARGATFPGLPYVALGHTDGYAWSATAGGSDLSDVRVERACTPQGGDPDSGTCVELDDALECTDACRPLVRRTDTWQAGTITVNATAERGQHGVVIGRATVQGKPVVLVRQRSTFFHELDAAPALILLNTGHAAGADGFRQAMRFFNSSFNWVCVDARNAVFFHSGAYPLRATDVHPDLPSWGASAYDWTGDFLATDDHPFESNPRAGFMVSWNNKPAPRWRAADNNYGYGSVYRSELLSRRLSREIEKGAVSVAEAVDLMADAATVDLRGEILLPSAIALARRDKTLTDALKLMKGWQKAGAHRRDRDGNGHYDEEAAVALMDSWYPKLLHAAFDGQLDGIYDDVPMGFDDAPSSNRGSAYQAGYYGYLDKAMRQALRKNVKGRFKALRCADGTKAGCAAAVAQSLHDALTELTAAFGADPTTWQVEETEDEIRFSVGGLLAVPTVTMPWQNRPTFQQVVQVQ